MSIAESVLPRYALVISEKSWTGVQIGDVIITNEEIWTDFDGAPAYTLLICDGSVVDINKYPILYTKYIILPDLPDASGSPFPYKVVADLYT